MNRKPVILRALAAEDIENAIQHYLDDGAIEAASGFIEWMSITETAPADH